LSDSENERRRLSAELQRLVECVPTLPPSTTGYERYPYFRAHVHWGAIAAIVKGAAEWLSLAGNSSAFASKPWLQLQLSGDTRSARAWPIDDLVRDLKFIQRLLAGATESLPREAASTPVIRERREPTRRSPRYEAIDKELIAIAAARPKRHEEVFRSLDARRIKIPDAKPFKSAGGWIPGFEHDPARAHSWLSQAWSRLNLTPFPRGPK
jgi:hypothetical protein